MWEKNICPLFLSSRLRNGYIRWNVIFIRSAVMVLRTDQTFGESDCQKNQTIKKNQPIKTNQIVKKKLFGKIPLRNFPNEMKIR